jgi:hypothetical protein
MPEPAIETTEPTHREQLRSKNASAQHRVRLQQQLETVRKRMDQAYSDKLDGKISEEFWQRKMTDWQARRATH